MSALEGVEDLYELTALQQGMLFQTLYAPESTAYTIQLDVGMEGDVDAVAFESAWQTVLNRYTTLRTSFVWERIERPYQLVHRQVQGVISWHDWTALPPAEQAARRAAFIAEDRARPFDLTRPPLVRLAVQLLAPHKSRLVWTFHHMILEGWSAAIVLETFRLAYESLLRSGRVGTLAPAIPYVEYVRWLRRQDPAQAQAFWRSALKGLAAPTQLPIDRSTSSGPAAVKAVDLVTVALAPELHGALQELARSNRITLNTMVHGLWAILLSRYSNEADIAFGTVASGRPSDLPGAASIVGLFVNTLPVRVVVDAEAALMPWLQRLQLELASMREVGYSSLVDIQSWSDIPAGQPLFHTLVAFENWLDSAGPPDGDIRFTDRAVHEASDQPLTLCITFDAALTLTLMYDVERFDAAPMARMLGHFETLLRAMLATPQTQLGDLVMLGAAERRTLLVDWNQTTTAYPREQTISQLFEAEAVRAPEATALEHLGRTMSYAELDARANQLAHYLRRHGVGVETPVALAIERSFEMVVAVLAILKAGAAYLPLDPASPPARLAFMLDDAAAPVLLTQSVLLDHLPPYGGRIVAIDAERDAIEREPVHALPTLAGPTNLAYLIYTSGSTGQPKGTCIEQRSVVRLVKDTNFVDLGPQQVFLQYATISFDASTFELWGCLLNGGRLVICPPGLQSLADLGRLIRDSGVTVLWLTSALFNQMVNEQSSSLRGVRQLLAGGEAVSARHARQLLESMEPGGRLINGYGPTENTTFTTTFTMTPDASLGESVPIGRPISNTRVYILDAERQPVPIGIWGELHIGGDGLARGYLHQPELTARSFIPDPFSADPGARLYRSGDLVRYREDGNIEFAGRIDRQVKLYGLRLEPGEIESALRRHPGVVDAVATVLGEQPETRRLVAYVVGAVDAPPTPEALRAHLRKCLPATLVPAEFVLLDALPLTPNGKVDRGALPEPGGARPLATPFVAPRSEREQRIAATWQEILRVERVGIDDNFFDLGGNSLLVMRVHSRLQGQGESALRVVDLFRCPTVRVLAAHLGATEASASASATASAPGADLDSVQERARKRRQAMSRQHRA